MTSSSRVPLATSFSLYDMLGVTPTASTTEIRSAFLRLALQLHPDKCGGGVSGAGQREAAGRFVAVKEAADVLLDVQQRWEYDVACGVRPPAEAEADAGAISDTLDLASDFTEVLASTGPGDGTRCGTGTVRIFQCECRCGGLYEVLVGSLDCPSRGALHSMLYGGERRVRHVVACDSCSLVVEVAGRFIEEEENEEEKSKNTPPPPPLQ